MLMYRKKKKIFKDEDFATIAADTETVLDLSRRFMKPDTPPPRAAVWRMLDRLFERFEKQIRRMAEGALPLSSLAPELTAIATRFRDTGAEQIRLSTRMAEDAKDAATAGIRMADLARQAALHSTDIAQSLALCMSQGRIASKGMDHIDRETLTLSEQVRTLASDAGRIDAIIRKIATIADDTGLLSLNASIEAARSGAVGAGFGVIAQEIRRLSVQVAEAAEEVHAELSRIRRQVNATTEAVDRVKGCVTEGNGAIASVLHGLDAVESRHITFVRDMEVVKNTAEAQSGTLQSIRDAAGQVGDGIEKRNAEGEKILLCAEKIRTLTEIQLLATGAFHLDCHRRAREGVAALAASTALRSGQRTLREGVLRDFVAATPYVELAYMTDSNGFQTVANQFRNEVKASYASDGFGENWSQRPWFREASVQKKAIVSDIYRSKATDTFCCTVSVPIREEKNDGLYRVVAVDIHLEELLKI